MSPKSNKTHQKHIPLCRNRLVPFCGMAGDHTDVVKDVGLWGTEVTCHRCKVRLKDLGLAKLQETREFMARSFDTQDERQAASSEGCNPQRPDYVPRGEIPQ